MQYHALACDYDGTLARHGEVDATALAALERVRASGRKLILVTGRQLDDLQRVFPSVHCFDRVVAENGALLFRPDTRDETALSEAPPEAFVAALRRAGVEPLAVGRVIVATWQPNEATVLRTIRELGLELQVIFNKGAVMVLPSGINKATGLQAALTDLHLSPHNTVGIGDAENDHAFLRLCECAVAVANALPIVKEQADLVTRAEASAGVVEIIDALVGSDLTALRPRQERHDIVLGTRRDGAAVRFNPHAVSMLIAGTSGSGKSTFATSVLERLADRNYQFCVIDPEGDYQEFEPAVVAGDGKQPPAIDAVLQLLEKPDENVVVNLLGLSAHDRPPFFERLFAALLDLRLRTGRPHWILLDETHHLLPASEARTLPVLSKELHGIMLITVHPDHVARAVLSWVDLIVAIGVSPEQTLATFAKTLGERPPRVVPPVSSQALKDGEAIAWWRRTGEDAFYVSGLPPRAERRRHMRKYAEGELGEDHSFYFRGPEAKLNLRAQNLTIFLQLADGVDDDTWMHHLRAGDYARWFRSVIKDEELAQAAERIAADAHLSPRESRAHLRAEIESRYSAPA